MINRYFSYKAVACLFLVIVVAVASCRHEPGPVPHTPGDGNFPPAIASILVTKCATAGCHNAASYENAGGLLLDSWEHLFEGGNNGAVVIPYSVDYSPLLYFINHDSTLGPVAEPRMPLNGAPLSSFEYTTIRNWIANGAPDKDGNIPFASSPDTRQKIYSIHQKCDMVAVIDAESQLVMRYIPIGVEPYPEYPSFIQCTADGRFAYVGFWFGANIQKIDLKTDEVVSTVNVQENFWSVLHLSGDGQRLVITNGDNHNMFMMDALTSQFQTITSDNDLNSPHGIASNRSFDTFFVTGLWGNIVYKFAPGYTKKISIDKQPFTITSSTTTPNPYQITMSPDYSKYFVTCFNTHEVRVMDAYSDTLIKVIPVGTTPRNMAISKSRSTLFVSCMDDFSAIPGMMGSVYAIDYNTLSVVMKIEGKFYQPSGLTVDDRNNTLYIFSRNQNYDGPAPHHQGPCVGRNGYYSVYDLNTLEPLSGRRYELLVDPLVSDVRFE